MRGCVCQDLMSRAEADRALPAQFRFSSIWNPPCAKCGSRHKKDIDSLDGVQRQALAMIKGLWAWHLSRGSKNWIFTAGLNAGLRGLVTSARVTLHVTGSSEAERAPFLILPRASGEGGSHCGFICLELNQGASTCLFHALSLQLQGSPQGGQDFHREFLNWRF